MHIQSGPSRVVFDITPELNLKQFALIFKVARPRLKAIDVLK